ncbi:MAG: hypothetical protein U0457_02170 [Candidatus Sericytochromatia bacterium]
MSKLSKILVITSSIILATTSFSCRRNQPEIGSTCKRLNDCYNAYSKLIKDAAVKKTVETAINLSDETSCSAALQDLGKVPEIQTQGGCPF